MNVHAFEMEIERDSERDRENERARKREKAKDVAEDAVGSSGIEWVSPANANLKFLSFRRN